MKRIVFFIFTLSTTATNAFTVCGPNIPADVTTAYTTTLKSQTAQLWAVGTNCAGETTATDVTTMCDTITAAGQAYPASVSSEINANPKTTDPIDFLSLSVGGNCMCRRTHVMINGTLTADIGQWVVVGAVQKECAQICARTVATNSTGLRNAIMLLPSML